MLTPLFWKDAVERVVATMAQALLALMLTDGFDLLNLDVKATVVAVATAGLLSLVKAIVAAYAVKPAVSPASLVHDDRGVVSSGVGRDAGPL